MAIWAQSDQAAEEYRVDEVLLLPITYEHEVRRRSYELIAEEMGLAVEGLARAQHA